MIKYGEKQVVISKEVFEVLGSLSLTFPYPENRGKPFISAQTTKVVDKGDGNRPSMTNGRVLSQELGPAVENVSFPLLDDQGNPTGQTMTVGEYFQATESIFIRLAQFQDS